MTASNSPSGDFTAQAEAYSRARPGYPRGLLDQLLRHTGVRPGDPVADLGAGTGLFTQLLAERGLTVTAVEPNDAMRARGRAGTGVRWAGGTFEATGLGDASQTWVTAAQAFHWADPARALPELRRVLRPGGWLSVLWNNRVTRESAPLRFTEELIRRHAPAFDDHYRDNRDWAAVLTSTGDFADPAAHEAEHAVAMPRQRYLDLWRSHNRLAAAAGPQGLARLLAELEQYLRDGGVATVVVPYLTRAWTVRRA